MYSRRQVCEITCRRKPFRTRTQHTPRPNAEDAPLVMLCVLAGSTAATPTFPTSRYVKFR
ncbi:MAG: hypothetical protein ACREU9_00030 [Gammaproteobacteria bacterium]